MAVDPVSLAITVALDAASMALSASRRIEGPRLTDLSATVADYGTPLNYFYGVRRLECPSFYCEPITETKHTTKGKTGKYGEYKYYGTFAIIVADHQINSYRRIWFDRHLVYDTTGSGEAITDPSDGSTLGEFMREYYGTSFQSPDPRMVATITANEGPDLCPSYLDIAYLFFEDLPLEQLGNRFPQVSVEACGIEGADTEITYLTDFPITITIPAPTPYPDCYPTGLGFPDYGMLAFWQYIFYAGNIATGDVGHFTAAGNWASNGQYDDTSAENTAAGMTIHMELTPGDGEWTFVFTSSVPASMRGIGGSLYVVFQSGPCLLPFDIAVATGGAAGQTGNPLVIFAHLSGYSVFPALAYSDMHLNFDQFDGAGGFVDSCTITLGEICTDVATRAGLNSFDFDFSDLDEVINGYSWTIGQGRDILAHLLDIYDSDIYPHGFILAGRKRGGDDDGPEIDTPFLVRQKGQSPNSSQQPLYSIAMAAESDLPRRVFATFADLNAEQQPNTAVAQRNYASTLTVREVTVDVTTLALTPDSAQPLVERFLRRLHIGATTVNLTASVREIGLEPADIRVLNLDGELIRARLTHMTHKADRSIACTFEQDSAVVATISAAAAAAGVGAVALGRPSPVIFNPTASVAFLLDIPLVSDADNQTTPFAYLAAGRVTNAGTFPGSDFQHSDTGADGTFESGWDAILSSNEAVWGTCQTVLGDALPWIPDRRNKLTVHIANGFTLESQTDAYLAANPSVNLAAIGTHAGGWEIVQFGDGVMVSAGHWEISNFYRRGVKGTERFIATHGAAEKFVLLERLTKHSMGAGEIGDTDYYRSVTVARDPESADQISVNYTAQAHRPLSPVHVHLSRDTGSGDWSGSWTRRTRVGGGSVNGQDVPLGEASEAYRVKIMAGAVVKRTINVTDPSFIYLSADQVTDWGSDQTALDILVCQMDPTLSIEGAATSASA